MHALIDMMTSPLCRVVDLNDVGVETGVEDDRRVCMEPRATKKSVIRVSKLVWLVPGQEPRVCGVEDKGVLNKT